MGAKIIWEKNKYRCRDYDGSDTNEVIFAGGPTTKKYPITCYSHTPITKVQLNNRPNKNDSKPLTKLDNTYFNNPNGIAKVTSCSGHRKINDNPHTKPNVIAKAGELSYANQVNAVRDAIAMEIVERRKHVMYISIADAENAVDKETIEYKQYIVKLQTEITDADKEERGYPNKQINFTQYVSASDLNTLKDITDQVMDDCVCYSDCNSYAVCWCHGYCNYY